MKKKLLIIISVIISVIMISLIYMKNIEWYDKTIYDALISFKSNGMTIFNKVISYMCNPIGFICIMLLIIVFYYNKKTAGIMTLNLGLSCAVSYIIKEIFKRARPIGIALIEETGYSMPSSHAFVSIAFYGFIIYLIYKKNSKTKLDYFISILLTIFILLVGLSRIYLGVHFASDVTLGFTLGFIYLVIFTYYYKKVIKIDTK